MCEIIATIEGGQALMTKIEPGELDEDKQNDPKHVGKLVENLYNLPPDPYKCEVTEIPGALKVNFTRLYAMHLVICLDTIEQKRVFKTRIFNSYDSLLQEAERIVSAKDLDSKISQIVDLMETALPEDFVLKLFQHMPDVSFFDGDYYNKRMLTVDTIKTISRSQHFTIFMKLSW